MCDDSQDETRGSRSGSTRISDAGSGQSDQLASVEDLERMTIGEQEGKNLIAYGFQKSTTKASSN